MPTEDSQHSSTVPMGPIYIRTTAVFVALFPLILTVAGQLPPVHHAARDGNTDLLKSLLANTATEVRNSKMGARITLIYNIRRLLS